MLIYGSLQAVWSSQRAHDWSVERRPPFNPVSLSVIVCITAFEIHLKGPHLRLFTDWPGWHPLERIRRKLFRRGRWGSPVTRIPHLLP